MFRRSSSSLPPDPEFPHDLEKLGYQINEKDQIRSIDFPDREFHYFISKNDRVLDKQREAMDDCIRQNLLPRFHSLGLSTTRLPPTASPTDPHIPILTSPSLRTAKRILLYLGESEQDLGILAYRICGRESLFAGSIIPFVTATQNGPQGNDTAIVIANPGQLVWYRRGARTMTLKSWGALPWKNGVSGGRRLDALGNKVVGHENAEEHVARVFEYVRDVMAEGAVVDVVGLVEGGMLGVRYLDRHWDVWGEKVRAMAVGLNYVYRVPNDVGHPDFLAFWAKSIERLTMGQRARAYLIHPDPLDTPLHGREPIGCNCFSSGESVYSECIIPRCHTRMLAFFDLVNSVPGYEEVEMEVPADRPQGPGMVEWVEGDVVRTAPGVTFSMGEEGGRGEGTV